MSPETENQEFDTWLKGAFFQQKSTSHHFTVEREAAQRHGFLGLGFSDIPLLLLAGAVEGDCTWFRVHGQRDLMFSWDKPLGPCGERAQSLLTHSGVDARRETLNLELPGEFWDYLNPFQKRTGHAPLSLIWGDRVTVAGRPGYRATIQPSSRPSVTLVDRGIDFPLGAGFDGLDIVAQVKPMPGAPWPRRLVWGPEIEAVLREIAAVVEENGDAILGA